MAMVPKRRSVRPGTKRLDTIRAQSSVRSQTHGIPSWEHPRTAASTATATPKRLPPCPYRPPVMAARTNTARVTGTNTDHFARLHMDDEPTPMRMMVSYGSGRVSCCPSLGEITMDASEAPFSTTSHHTVVSHQSDQCNSSAPTVTHNNLSSAKPNGTVMNQPTVSSFKDQSDLSIKKQSMVYRNVPRNDPSNVLPPPTFVNRAVSSDSAKSSESDIFCQRKGLSFRCAPPDVNMVSFSATKKLKKKNQPIDGSKASSDILESRESDEVTTDQQEKEQQPVVPTFKTPLKTQKGGMETGRQEIHAGDRRKNISIVATSTVGTSYALHKPSPSVLKEKAVSSVLKGREYVVSSSEQTQRSTAGAKVPDKAMLKARKFLPTPLHFKEERSIEFVFGDIAVELENCSVTATSTSNTSPTCDETAFSIEEMVHCGQSTPERSLHREPSSSSLDDFLNASMAHSRGSLFGESYGESSAAGCFAERDERDDLYAGLGEDEMLTLALIMM